MPANIWDHQLRHFASAHRVVALDPRGQGRSEKPTYGYQPSRRALDIGELLEHLGGEPPVLVGWSLAMQEVLVLAYAFGTENIQADVLVDHPIYIENPERFASRFISLQVEREETLPNASVVSFGTYDYRRYDGQPWEWLGIPPDIRVTQTAEDVHRGRDPQLEYALSMLR